MRGAQTVQHRFQPATTIKWDHSETTTFGFSRHYEASLDILLPVIAILADHLDVPSRTLCLTALMWPEWDFLSTPNTDL